MNSRDAKKTAFLTQKEVTFLFSNKSATFQRLTDHVLGHMKWTMTLVFLDNIIVYGHTFEEHCTRLTQVLNALCEANLKLKPDKCHFGYTEVTYLGPVVSKEGVRPDPEKACPRGVSHDLNSKRLSQFSSICFLLSQVCSKLRYWCCSTLCPTKKDSTWNWGASRPYAFKDLKDVLLRSPTLAHFVEGAKTFLHRDASGHVLSAVLLQKAEDRVKRVIAYTSSRLNEADTRYHPTELECLVILWVVKKFRCYLYRCSLAVVLDSSAMQWLQFKSDLTLKLTRWAMQL